MIIKNDSHGKTLQYLSGRCRNNVKPDFTDQEIMTIYIYIMRIEQHFRISEIYVFADQYQEPTTISKVRQSLESLFNWLIEGTDIQRAAKARPAKGLFAHLFGRITAVFSNFISLLLIRISY